MPRAGKAPLTVDLHKQTLTFAGAVLAQLPMISEERQQYYIGKQDRLNRVLREAFAKDLPAANSLVPCDVLELNEKLYHSLFGKVPDFSGVAMPQTEGDGPFLTVLVCKELVEWTGGTRIEGVFQARKKLYPTWKYTTESLDAIISVNERSLGNGTYAFAARESVTPDADLMNLSANDVASRKFATMTALEYQLFETAYFLKHGVHLDEKTWTLLSGSRCRDGGVPRGSWRDGSSYVDWFSPSGRGPDLGSRRVWI